MLTALRISGFAIVDQAEVRFGPGLSVITGETGAGKSILLSALQLAVGGRMTADVLRDGAEEAVVEALFELPPGSPVVGRLLEAGLPVSEEAPEVLVRRIASRSGRGRVFVNGALCTVAMLEACLRGLVDITGQHEHVALMEESSHLPLLDSFGGLPSDEGGLLAQYRSIWSALGCALRERDALVALRDERARHREELAVEIAEIEKVSPRPGEDAELDRERQVLGGAEKLRNAARMAEALVYGEAGSAAEQLGRAARAVKEAAGTDVRLAPALTALQNGLAEVEEAGRSLARYADTLDGDPERLAQVEERLAILKRLVRKHGGTVEAVLAHEAELRAQLAQLEDVGQRLASLDGDVEAASARTIDLARQLTQRRAAAAAALPREVGRELERVGMAHARIEVEMLPPENGLVTGGVSLGADGAERVRFLFTPNPGEPPRPLARIASGGELSRIVLAMKRALARVDPVDTYVFDEVDAGVGGSVADGVGNLLSEVSRQRQVLCVTHLPQVAAFAEHHFKVEKHVRGGRTLLSVVTLESAEARRAEVARMLAGASVTGSALEHARALIACARSTGREPGPRIRAPRNGPVRTAARTARVNALTPRVRG